MKNIYIPLAVCASIACFNQEAFSQNIAINTEGTAAAATNMFEVTQSSTAANMVALYAIHNGATAAGISGYGFQAIKTGATGINIAGYFSASGGGSNYAIVVPSTGGSVGIGTIAPAYKLDVTGGSIGGTYGLTPKYTPWSTYGTGDGGAAVYNDGVSYQTLMIVGNNSAGGVRRVSVWDYLTVNGNQTITGLAGTGTRMVQANASGVLSALAAGNTSQVLLGDGTWGSIPPSSGNYIQNQFAGAQATANHWVSGSSRATEVYAAQWFRNDVTGTGLYNQANNAGIYSPAASLMSTYASSNFRIEGNLLIGNQGSANSYGALTLRGEKNGWGGISFQNTAGTLLGTLMVGANTHGFFNNSDNNWNYYWNGGAMQIMNTYSPTNNVMRMTPNFHLNSMAGYAVIANWDNGAVAAGTQVFRVGNGASADQFYVTSSGDAYTTRYSFAQYTNTTDNSVASGVTGIMVKAGDNYLRTGTAAAVNAFLGTSPGWSITGNSNIVDGTNFLGTTNSVPLNFRVNNLTAGRISHTDLLTAFGYKAINSGQGYGVVAIGYEALMSSTRSNDGLTYAWGNVCVGYQTMKLTTTGSYNTALGNGTLQNNTVGKFNAAFGNVALSALTTASCNTAFGTGAARYLTTGSWNTFIGDSAGQVITTGTKNIFIGYNADASATFNNLTNAIAIGSDSRVSASNAMVLGNGSVDVGIGTSSPGLALPSTNQLVAGGRGLTLMSPGATAVRPVFTLDNENTTVVGGTTSAGVIAWSFHGYNDVQGCPYVGMINCKADGVAANDVGGKLEFALKVDGGCVLTTRMQILNSGLVGIGRTPTTNILEILGDASKTTAGSWLANSDRRIKTDIRDIDNATAIIMKLRPVTFRYTDEWKERNSYIKENDHAYYNFIAQEYKEVFPESVKGSGEYLVGDTTEILQIDTYNSQIVAIKAIQELNLKSELQQKEIDELKVMLAKLLKENKAVVVPEARLSTTIAGDKKPDNEKTFTNDLGETPSQKGYAPPAPVIPASPEKNQKVIFSPALPQ